MYRFFAIIIAVCVLFSGCTPRPDSMEYGLSLRETLFKSKECSFLAEIIANFEDAKYFFTVDCEVAEDQTFSFNVIDPDLLSGISGQIDKKDGRLTFEDKVLYFPLLAEGQLPPICAPWVFYNALVSGYIHAAGEEDGHTRLTINDTFQSENITLEIWLKNGTPVYSEIVWQGRNILCLTISEFQPM